MVVLGILATIKAENEDMTFIHDGIDVDQDVDILIGVIESDNSPTIYRVPKTKNQMTPQGVLSSVKSILSILSWQRPANLSFLDEKEVVLHLYHQLEILKSSEIISEDRRKDEAKRSKGKKKKLAELVFLVHFSKVGGTGEDGGEYDYNQEILPAKEKEEMLKYRGEFLEATRVESLNDDFKHNESIVMTIVKWDQRKKEELYRVSYRIDSLAPAQQKFLLLMGTLRRDNNLPQIIATPLENSSFQTLVSSLECIIELCCLGKIEASLKKAKKIDAKSRAEDEDMEEVSFNVAYRLEQMREEISISSIHRGFSFDGSTVLSSKTTKVFATEFSSACKIIKTLSQSGCFESITPAIESQVVIGIVDRFAGSISSYFSNKRPQSKLLFANFEREEYSYLALKYNETSKIVGGKDFRFSNSLFHVDARHISLKTDQDDTPHHVMGSKDVGLQLEDVSEDSRNHQIIDFVHVDCTRFSFDVNKRHVLGSKKNVSKFVCSQLLSSKGGPAEFRRDKNGNVTMHIPVSTNVNHTGRYQEPEEDKNDDEFEGMDVDDSVWKRAPMGRKRALLGLRRMSLTMIWKWKGKVKWISMMCQSNMR